MKASIRATLEAIIDANSDQSVTDIQAHIESLNHPELSQLTSKTLRRYIQLVREARVLIEAEVEQVWTVEDGNYVWTVGKDRHHFCLSVLTVDTLFFEYSKHGLNLSQTEVINRHDLETWQWNSLKSRLSLVKNANVFSPHTWEITPPQERDQMVADKIATRFKKRGLIVEQQYTNAISKQYLKTIESADKTTYLNQHVLSELMDFMEQIKVVRLPQPFYIKHQIQHLNAQIADLHLGACVQGLEMTRDFNRTVLRGYLDQAADRINEVKAANVHLNVLGDWVESITGMNHKTTWQNMEWQMYGAPVIEAAVEEFEIFLAKVRNTKSVKGVGGNHDRLTSDAQEDPHGATARVIMYLLKRLYGKHIDVQYKAKVLADTVDGLRIIRSHGHLMHTKSTEKVQKLIYDYGDNQMFTLMLSGHLHGRRTFMDGLRQRWVVCPSIFGGNEWSQDCGYDSLPGMNMFHNEKGLPRFIDEPFQLVANK